MMKQFRDLVRKNRDLIIFVILVLFFSYLLSSVSFSQNIGNNTPACLSINSPTYCNKAFTGVVTTNTNTNAITQQIDIPPTNVSRTPFTKLLYPGATTKILFETQNWWCNATSPLCNTHINIGYDTISPDVQKARHDNMLAIASPLQPVDFLDFYGTTDSQQNPNFLRSQAMFADLALRCVGSACPILGAILEDKGAFNRLCPVGATDQTACIIAKINADADYTNTHWANQPYYLTDATNPIFGFFVDESQWSGTNWCGVGGVWPSVAAHVALYAHPFKLIFEFGSFATFGNHCNSAGEFGWPQPPVYVNTSSNSQLGWDSIVSNNTCNYLTGLCSGGVSYLDTLYNGCASNPTKLCFGMIYAGFDWSIVNYKAGVEKIVTKGAGQTLLKTAAKIAAHFGSSNQLKFLVIATLDDYEESTEIETGIDNKYSITASIVGTTVNWTFNKLDATYSSLTTFDHARVLYGASQCDTVLVDNIPIGTTTQDLSSLPPGNWKICAQGVGMPMIANVTSNQLSYVTNTPQSCSLQTVCLGPGVTTNGSIIVTVENNAAPIVVAVQPFNISIATSATQQYTAMVSGSTNQAVIWSVLEGATCGTINGSGLYTAPVAMPSPDLCHVQALSQADGITKGLASVTILTVVPPPVCTVNLIPQNVTLAINTTQQFTAVTNNCTPTTVVWKVNNITGGNSTIGIILANGLYTAPSSIPSPSTVVVTGVSNDVSGASGSASVSITGNINNGENAYCSAGDVPNFPNETLPNGHVVNGPQSCVYTDRTGTPSNGTVRTVTDLASWSTQTAAAVCGDVIELTPGTVLTGVTFPAKSCDPQHWITIRTQGFEALIPEHKRVTPCYGGVTSMPGYPNFNCGSQTTNVMATIKSPDTNTGAAFTISGNNTYLRIIGIHFKRGTDALEVAKLLYNNAGGIQHLIWDQIWCEGATQVETARCLNLDRVNYHAVINSFISDFHCISKAGTCTESQAINGGINTNNFDTDHAWKLYNNFLAASGENTLFGGAAGAVTPKDVEMRNNWRWKCLCWDPADPSYNGGVAGNAYATKNLEEYKTGDNVFIEGEVLQNVWGGFTQQGAAILISPKNQNGAEPVCETRNYIVRYLRVNTMVETMQTFNSNSAGFYCVAGNTYSIHDIIFDNIAFPGSNSGPVNINLIGNSDAAAPTSFYIFDIEMNHVTQVLANPTAPGTWPQALQVVGGPIGPLLGPKWQKNSITYAGNFGFNAVGGTDCSTGNQSTFLKWWNACWIPSSEFDYLCLVGGHKNVSWVWPGTHNQFPADSAGVLFNNYNNGNGGDYTLQAGSPCHAAADDGKDMGADINLVNSYTQGVDSF